MYRLLTHPLFLLIFFVNINIAHSFSEEELKWLDSEDNTETTQISEGLLKFVHPGNKLIFHSANTINIDKNSIDTGWVSLHQCYRQLDKLAEVDITYHYRFIRDLQIVSINNIQKASINKQTITLINISDNAEICIKAEVRIFYQNPDLTFSLVNGPYHRKFLDGFYPYHLTLKINYPNELLNFMKTIPPHQPGFEVSQSGRSLQIDTFFEGILNTEVIFSEILQQQK